MVRRLDLPLSQLLDFGPNGQFIREIGAGLSGWSFAHTVRIDRDDNIWAVDKGSDTIIKFNQTGRVVWGVRAQKRIRGRGRTVGTRQSSTATRGRPFPPAD